MTPETLSDLHVIMRTLESTHKEIYEKTSVLRAGTAGLQRAVTDQSEVIRRLRRIVEALS